MTAPHVDFESVGHIDRAEDVGRLWWATPIALPDSGIEALLIRVFDAWSSVFPEARLRDTDPVTVGQPGQNTGLALSDVGDGTFSGHRIGHTAPTDEAPHGFLAVSATGTGRIELWHLDPADIDLDALDPALRARILPDPTEATRGRYLRQSPDGETYELVGDPPADDGADYTPRFTTLQDVRNALAPGTSGKWATGGEMESILLGQIASAESEIVEITGEQFFLAATDPSDRLFRGANGYLETPYFAEVPESVTELLDRTATGGTAIDQRRWWPVTEPDGNRAGKMLEGPFETGFWYRVSARWGWLAVPYQVKQAARMSAARLFERQAAVLGVVAGEVPIYVMHQDPDVRRLLSPFTPLV